MDILLCKTDCYTIFSNYTLTYGNKQYHLYTSNNKLKNTTFEINFGEHHVEPKYITICNYETKHASWTIVDVYNAVHMLLVNSHGGIILRKSIITASDNSNILSIEKCNTWGYIMYRIDQDNNISAITYTIHKYYSQITVGILNRTSITLPHDTFSRFKVEHIFNEIYFVLDNNKLWKLHRNTIIEQPDYTIDNIQSTLTCSYNNNYTYNRCLNAVYKNGKIIHTFKENYYMITYKCSQMFTDKCVLVFASLDSIVHLVDDNKDGTIIIHKFDKPNLKFIDNINIPSLFRTKTKFKSTIITFMLANRIAKHRIPRLLLYDIIYLLTKN